MEMDVRHVAKLSKLKLSDEKAEKFEKEMQGILKMVENLPPLETGVLLDENNTMTLRADVVEPSFSRDELLKNAPETAAGCFKLPKLID